MPVPPSSAYPPGTTLTVGSHDVVTEQFIGEGGFAHVYTVRVSPAIPGQEIACLKRVQVPNKTYLNLLRAEVEAMQRLKGSSNIVEYYDSHAERMKEANTPGQYEVFLLMEYCSRGGLIDFMNTRLRDQLREHEILKIMSDITLGVAHMHYLSPPLLHRDLKIENVLIRGDGTYMLCDFGSASPVLRPPKNSTEFRILEDDIQHHTTVQYRAPEMIDLSLGQPIDEKSDIWALGIFLYKLCYYTTPFERPNQTLEQFQALILTSSYTIPPRPAYSERLRNMIRILLQPDPRLRPNVFQVMQEVCAMRHVECPIQDIYSRPRPVTQPMVMPGLQMFPGPAGTPAGTPAGPSVGSLAGAPPGAPSGGTSGTPVGASVGAHSPSVIPMQTVQNPPVKSVQQPIQLPQQSVSVPARPLQSQSGSEPMSPISTGSPEPGMYETEDDLAARYPSVEEIDRKMSFSSAKIPRRKSSDFGANASTESLVGNTPTSGVQKSSGAPTSTSLSSAPMGSYLGGPSGTTTTGTAIGSGGIGGTSKGGNAPLIDLDSPPAKPPRPQRDLSRPQTKAQTLSENPPALPKKPHHPGRPIVKSAPNTEYPMPQRPVQSRQTNNPKVVLSNELQSPEDIEAEEDDEGPFQESRMTSEASKLKQILTGIGGRPSTVIMDKPEETRSMSSVDFLRTLGNDGPSTHHHPHIHSKSRKHSLFYNSAMVGTTRQFHFGKEAEEDDEDDDEDEAYEFGGTNMRVGGQIADPEKRDAYVSTDDENIDGLNREDEDEDENNRFDFSDSSAPSPLASPAKIVPAQAPSTEPRTSPKSVKPVLKPGLKPAMKPVVKPTTKPITKPTIDPAAKPSTKPRVKPSTKPISSSATIPSVSSHGVHPVSNLPGEATEPVKFAGASPKPRPLSVVSHSTTELDAFQPTNSIQQRVRALLSGQERQHPPVRTAKGYGRFTDTFDEEFQPATRSKSMGSEVREVRELREMAPAVPSRESKPKAQLTRSFSAQSLVKQK